MNKVKFAVFTDLHYDHIPDGRKRLENFVNNVKDTDIDFVIELGDFCIPTKENKFLLDMLNTTHKPVYHLIGNHDSDLFPMEKVLDFLHMDNSYYSFKYGEFKFIVLDTCFIKTPSGYIPYCKRNYNKTEDIYPILPDLELKWLENQLNDADSKYFVIFSHLLLLIFANNKSRNDNYNVL